MKKIKILSKNEAFAEDLKHQIELNISEAEIIEDMPDEATTIMFVDEDLALLPQLPENLKDMPIVLFSSYKDIEENADLIIKKPFKLETVLSSLKRDTLLPKIRRKECLVINGYNIYPVKKEIVSSNNKICKLTEKEVDIIKYLYQTKSRIASKEDLLENVWKYSTDATTHTVETHIYRLRQKVEKEGKTQLIITENNGYRLNI